MKIEETAKAIAVPGDFGAHVEGDRLLLPQEVVAPLRTNAITTAEEFVMYTINFPTAVAQYLHWSLKDVGAASQKLVSTLRGHVEEELLRPAHDDRRVLGAFDPTLLDRIK